MRNQSKSNFVRNELITLKDQQWLHDQKIAGQCVAKILSACAKAIKDKTPNLSLKDLESFAFLYCKEFDCIPTFKGYRGFPNAICTSVNKQLVHGLVTDYVLQEGDLITVDVGATYNGAIADAARTWIYGEPKDKRHVLMLDVARKALQVGTEAVQKGKQIGAISFAIHKCAQMYHYGLITDYGGHGLDINKPHASPFVPNKDEAWNGARIVPGIAIAIEPMFTMWLDPKTKILDDKWTVVTDSLSCHFENSVTLMEDGLHIITEISDEDKL